MSEMHDNDNASPIKRALRQGRHEGYALGLVAGGLGEALTFPRAGRHPWANYVPDSYIPHLTEIANGQGHNIVVHEDRDDDGQVLVTLEPMKQGNDAVVRINTPLVVASDSRMEDE